jgi:hypothetical protein
VGSPEKIDDGLRDRPPLREAKKNCPQGFRLTAVVAGGHEGHGNDFHPYRFTAHDGIDA